MNQQIPKANVVIFVAVFSFVACPARAVEIPEPSQIRIERAVQLTDDDGYYMYPAWSPDGTKIAFTRVKSAGIEVMNADGSNRRVLTEEEGAGYKFAWSPDGREIAYRMVAARDGLRQNAIKKVEVATGKRTQLSEFGRGVEPPDWSVSSKGMQVAFMKERKRMATPLGGLPTEFGAAASLPAAERILFFAENNIWSSNADGSEARQLTFDAGFDPVWSPDRTRIVYSYWDTLMVMDADGGNKSVLHLGNRPSWSPDSRRIVFQISRDHTHGPDEEDHHDPETPHHLHDDKTHHQIVASELFIINADGTGRVQLTDTPGKIEVDPCWSPDGKRIVYRTEETGQIHVLHLTW